MKFQILLQSLYLKINRIFFFFSDRGYIELYAIKEEINQIYRINDIYVKYNDSFYERYNKSYLVDAKLIN